MTVPLTPNNYSETHNYLYIGEVRKPRQRECVGIVIH